MNKMVLGLLIVFTALVAVPYSVQAISACGSVATSDNLTTNISGTGTCITITSSNVELDCNGFTITFDTSGDGSAAGVEATGMNNLTVRNCNIKDDSVDGLSGIGISLTTVTNSTVQNNTIQTNGTSSNFGIHLTSSSNNNNITNNTVNAQGTGSSNFGIILFGSVLNTVGQNIIQTNGVDGNFGIFMTISASNSVINNTVNARGIGSSNRGIFLSGSDLNTVGQNIIRTNGTSSNFGIYLDISASNTFGQNIIQTNGVDDNFGIFMTISANNSVINNTVNAQGTSSGNRGIFLSGSDLNTVGQNIIRTNGTSSNFGIHLTSSSSNSVINNTVNARGTSSINRGIFLSGSVLNTVGRNIIQTSGTNRNFGIHVASSANNNNLTGNNISTSGTSSYAISIVTSNNVVFNNTVLSNPPEWISTSAGTVNNFTNTSFFTTNGAIRIFNFTITNEANITRAKLNISANRAFLNSANLTFLNTSAQIMLNGVNGSVLLVDFEDDGTYNLCNATQCQLESFNGSTAIFNVSSFTTYSTASFSDVNVTLSKSDTPDPINLTNTTILTYQINFTVTNGTAFNVTINEMYPANVTFINSTPSPTVPNTSWSVGNLSADQTYQINITVNVSSSLANGTIITNTVNVTFANSTGSSFNVNVMESTAVIAPIPAPPVPPATFANVSAAKTASVNGSIITYTIVLSSTGTEAAVNVTVKETYASGLLFLSSVPNVSSGNDTWFFSSLAVNSSTVITVILNATVNGTFPNSVNVSYFGGSGSSASSTTSISTLVGPAPVPPPAPTPSGGGGGGGGGGYAPFSTGLTQGTVTQPTVVPDTISGSQQSVSGSTRVKKSGAFVQEPPVPNSTIVEQPGASFVPQSTGVFDFQNNQWASLGLIALILLLLVLAYWAYTKE